MNPWAPWQEAWHTEAWFWSSYWVLHTYLQEGGRQKNLTRNCPGFWDFKPHHLGMSFNISCSVRIQYLVVIPSHMYMLAWFNGLSIIPKIYVHIHVYTHTHKIAHWIHKYLHIHIIVYWNQRDASADWSIWCQAWWSEFATWSP